MRRVIDKDAFETFEAKAMCAGYEEFWDAKL